MAGIESAESRSRVGGWQGPVVGGLLVAAALCVAELDALEFGAAGAVAGVGILLALGGLLAVWWLRGAGRRWGCALALAPVLAWLVAGSIGQAQRRASHAVGDEVCAALARFHEQNGRYPERLEALVPGWLAAVPDSEIGVLRRVPFGYERREGGYRLWFAAPAFIVCARGPDTDWKCDD